MPLDPWPLTLDPILARLVDADAVSLGELQCARDIVRRTRCADDSAYLVVAALFIALHSGEPSLVVADAPALIANACGTDKATEEEAHDAREFSRLVNAHWPAALATIPALAPFVVVSSPSTISFKRYHDAARQVDELLKKRVASCAASRPPTPDEDVFSFSRGDFVLSGEQRKAVETAVASRLAVITGGPGTGKTTIVCSIIRALVRIDGLTAGDIALAAPTGRAAQRMGEALRKQCLAADDDELPPREREILTSLAGSTIHSLLGGFAPHWRFNADKRIPRKLVVIDEASMIDLILMRALLVALPDDCRLVLLGDADQLPPVEAGAVLGRIVEDFEVSRLTVARRFTGSLRTCADEFRRGILATITSPASRFPDDLASAVNDPSTLNTCMWREPRDARAEIDAFLRDWADAHGLGKGGRLETLADAVAHDDDAFRGEMTPNAKALFDALDSSRILTVVHNGPFGNVKANETLLRNRLGRLPRENPLVASGIPVIILANTPALGLFNGDTGVTVKTANGVFALFARGEAVVACHVSRLPDFDLAYAITVHKSQGSEFGDVLAVLPDNPSHPLLTRRMVYTAITRARLRSVIFAPRASLEGLMV